MIYLYLFGTCFHFIYVFMIIGNYQIARISLVRNLQDEIIPNEYPVYFWETRCLAFNKAYRLYLPASHSPCSWRYS